MIADKKKILRDLLGFYYRTEKQLSARLSHSIWDNQDRKKGAKEAFDVWLRKIIVEDLQKAIPDTGIKWDDQIDIASKDSHLALLDLVDGAKEYSREGANITSHIGVYEQRGTELGSLDLGIVSYPFHRFRVITFGDDRGCAVYYLPFDREILPGDIVDNLERLKPSQLKKEKPNLNVVDRYVDYNKQDPMRRKLDLIREEVIREGGSYTVSIGSIAKTITDVAIGVSDIAVFKHNPLFYKDLPLHDYLTPSKILMCNCGVFLDLDGKQPNNQSINGFIAAANSHVYEMFMNW